MITPDIRELVANMRGQRVMIVGDVMLDHYTFGTVSRISPEAPVPVLQVCEDKYLLGGAGNVARNIVALGGRATILGVIGRDQDGEKLTALMAEAGADTDFVQDDRRRTTRKTRIIAQNQQIVRVDREAPEPLDPSVVGVLLEKISRAAQGHDIVIVSDYGKGVVTSEIMDAVRGSRGASGARPTILVDPKPQNYDLYHGVDILTPNAKEAGEGAGIAIQTAAPGADAAEALRQSTVRAGLALFHRLRCAHLLITLGAQGMALFESPTRARRIPTFARKVFDVTGAGDTVIAALGLALAAGADLLQASILANHAAGIVVGQVGAATASPHDLLQAFDEIPAPEVEDLLGLA